MSAPYSFTRRDVQAWAAANPAAMRTWERLLSQVDLRARPATTPPTIPVAIEVQPSIDNDPSIPRAIPARMYYDDPLVPAARVLLTDAVVVQEEQRPVRKCHECRRRYTRNDHMCDECEIRVWQSL